MNSDLYAYAWATIAAGFASRQLPSPQIASLTDEVVAQLENRVKARREKEEKERER